jgi:phospholipid/cholesterol/gamma-HCH transport system substrate-binding protein
MNEKAMSFRLGVFVLAAGVLALVLVALLGGFPNLFRRYESYAVNFRHASGVNAGTPVRRSGVRVGDVQSVILDNDTGKVQLAIRVDKDVVLRKSDRPSLSPGLLGGGASIDFLPAPPPAPDQPPPDNAPAPTGFVFEGSEPSEPGNLLKRANELMPTAEDALRQMTKTMQLFDKTIPLFQSTLKEFQNTAKSANEFSPELSKTNAAIRKLAESADATMPELKKTNLVFQSTAQKAEKAVDSLNEFLKTTTPKFNTSLDSLDVALKRVNGFLTPDNEKNLSETLRNFNASSAKFDRTMGNADSFMQDARESLKVFNQTLLRLEGMLGDVEKTTRVFREKSPTILTNLETGTDKLDKLIGDLRDLLRLVARGEGTVQRLLNDPSLYNNVNETVRMVRCILPRMDRILGDLEVFADRLARHPEALGLRGVISPSNGLKGPPSPGNPARAPGH